jgi:hypothetical protein
VLICWYALTNVGGTLVDASAVPAAAAAATATDLQ